MNERCRIAGDGAWLLYDEEVLSSAQGDVACWFDRAGWSHRGVPLSDATGRGEVFLLGQGANQWVLRHYHRGGFIARIVHDHYLWTGLARTRAFREWRLLAQLSETGLPVPQPVAARVVRRGLVYQADIVTGYLAGTQSLAVCLDDDHLDVEHWTRIGAMVRAVHDHGVDHPDLTAHNVLIGESGQPFLVDFDNARCRPSGKWREAGLARFERSLRKVALETGREFDAEAWARLVAAYGDAGAGSSFKTTA